MTKEEAIRKHREMWRWLAKNPGERKRDYLDEFDLNAELHSDCYLCEYNKERHCCDCPLDWGIGGCARNNEGLYSKWLDAMNCKNYIRAAELARQIAELPEKEKIK